MADVVTLRYLESRGAAELAQAMTAEEAEASYGSPPFIPSFFTGHRPSVEARVRGASGPGGLRVAGFELRLRDVKYSPRRMLALTRSRFSQATTVEAGEVIAQIHVRSADIAAYLRSRGADVDKVRVTSAGVTVTFRDPEPEPGTTPGPGASPSPSPRPSDGPPEEHVEEVSRAARYLPRVEEGMFRLQVVSVAKVRVRFREDAFRIAELVSLPRFPSGLRTDIRLGKGVITIEATGTDVEKSIGEDSQDAP